MQDRRFLVTLLRVKVLLIEDDKKLTEHLDQNLRQQGFFVTAVTNENELSETLNSNLLVELVLMDRLIGAVDSKNYLAEIKKKWPKAPVLVVSAISTPNERTDLINAGADDYVGKPFSTQELIARMRALLRRQAAPNGNYLQVGNIIIDTMKRIVTVGERAENLPTREFSVLSLLARDPSRVWSKDELLDYVWGQAATVDTNVVESTMTNLRRKLTELGANVSIKNMRNAGYWLAT